ncbi:branched-chain amino acid transaminase [Actinomadura terrae]|uniref:branched-chain amino acid transaminase n=1 Tax=Actinomadura terrae TaxID=604353 RepID=UPI001FA7392D|nr:branched-chain amino acid transaminase [Actinomadura terrae]
MIEAAETLWLDGELVRSDTARADLLTHTLHYGFGAFDGIRCYRQDDGGQAMFRVGEHMRRLRDSAAALSIPIEHTEETLVEAARGTIKANGLADAYVRPLVYVGEPNIIFAHWLNEPHTAVLAFAWSGYSDRNREEGTTATFSSHRRPKAHAGLYKAKACGHYLLSVVAYSEAKQRGFAQAIFIDEDGMVCEATGENIFAVHGSVVSTPPASRSLLPGITRDTVMRLAADLGYEVVERDLGTDDLLGATEVFSTGTASELLPIPEIDGRKIGGGAFGPVTQSLQQTMMDIVRGRAPDPRGWMTPV